MRLISAVWQRWEDWKRERKIALLAGGIANAMDHCRFFTARILQEEMVDEIRARSPEQVARMERKRRRA